MRFQKIDMFCLLLGMFLIVGNISCQRSLLQSGPMVGYSSMMEVPVWVQLKSPGLVKMEYWSIDDEKTRFSTREMQADSDNGNIVVLIADQLVPGHKYNYDILVNNTKLKFDYDLRFQSQTLWQWRTDPPSFKFAAGSCFYVNEEVYDRPGRPYGGEYEILSHMHASQPDFMVWLGDNTYLREVDWDSRTGYYHRYTHTRSFEGLQPLLAGTHHYAIWDDHDYGPNDSDRTWRLKEVAKSYFNQFWVNPPFGAIPQEGITNQFQWADCDFFLLDGRWFKSPNSMPGTVLGSKQLEWLKGALLESSAPFKFVCLGVMFLSTAENKENMFRAAPDERTELISFIQEHKIEGVIFITGDRHFAELSVLTVPGKVPIYDFTTSPLTAGLSTRYLSEVNELMFPDSRISKRNFGLIEVSGSRNDRLAVLKLIDSRGEVINEYKIHVSEFKPK